MEKIIIFLIASRSHPSVSKNGLISWQLVSVVIQNAKSIPSVFALLAKTRLKIISAQLRGTKNVKSTNVIFTVDLVWLGNVFEDLFLCIEISIRT